MQDLILYEPVNYLRCWLGYFDLLGIKDRILSSHRLDAIDTIAKGIEQVKKRCEGTEVHHFWFSDTFILYTLRDDLKEFAKFDVACRWFLYFMVTQHIPLRGSISHGAFYADQPNSLYVGPALVEAYEYGESQDWIGLMLCPTAVTQARAVGASGHISLNYSSVPVPFKKGIRTTSFAVNHPVAMIGKGMKFFGGNPYVKALEEMKKVLKRSDQIQKYDNTIAFTRKALGL